MSVFVAIDVLGISWLLLLKKATESCYHVHHDDNTATFHQHELQSFHILIGSLHTFSVLNGPAEGGPYNRLILQTESGEAWESNEDGDGDDTFAQCSAFNCSSEHMDSCHTLLFLKDQAAMDAKPKRDTRCAAGKDLPKIRVMSLEFPKYTPQLTGH